MNKRYDKPPVSKEEGDKIRDLHLDDIKKIAHEGKLIPAGPFLDPGGIFIFNTIREDSANDWLSPKRAVAEGLHPVEFRKLYIAKGAFCEKYAEP